jgi:nucleotide-binding universal stress UspA family protein
MSFQQRLLVGLTGREPDAHLIRYASMVFRLNCLSRSIEQAARPLDGLVLDSSAADASAVARAGVAGLADQESEVRFIHLPGDTRAEFLAEPLSSVRSILRSHVAEHFNDLTEYSFVACDAVKSFLPERLATFAADFDSDLLLLGDASWPRRQSARVAMQAPCSVWLVPASPAPVLRRLLVATDFSSRSAKGLQVGIDLARRFPPAKCLALHVYQDEIRWAGETADRLRRRELSRLFEQFVAGLDTQGVRVEPLFVASHDVARAIALAAERHSVDLVVLSTRGRSPVASLMLPGTVETAIRKWTGAALILKSAGTPAGLLRSLWERLCRTEDPLFS